MFTRKGAALGLVIVLLAAGCAKPPQEKLDGAIASLTLAEENEAGVYAPDLFQAARDSLAAAQLEIEAQGAASAFTRNYGKAERLLAFAAQTASEAQTAVAERKEEMRAANEELFVRTEEAIARVAELIKQAPRGKDGAVALVAIQDDSETATQTLAQARAAQTEGAFAQARDLAQAALDKANALVGELESAIAKTNPQG